MDLAPDGEGDFTWRGPNQLFHDRKLGLVKICAPMVRYSKLPFRMLVRKYNCDIAFTPMIIANSFVSSLKARDSEFTTCFEDRPLVVQFAASDPKHFADAAEIVYPFSDGVDLNCGCPQRWAQAEGYGVSLIKKPELIRDMVRQAKARVSNDDFTVSMKIRIHNDPRETVEMCRLAESVGLSWITVHGRTREQRNQPVNYDSIKLIKENVSIPVIANGDIRTLDEATSVQELTGVDGVMSARGILSNPAMFSGLNEPNMQCVKDWVHTAVSLGTNFQYFHHILMYMLERSMPKAERRVFNTMSSTSSVIDYLKDNLEW